MIGDPAFVDEPTVEVTRVSKWFKQKVAVSDLSCSFGRGLTGLLGPNGAGKTTLLRMLCGLTLPSEGDVRVFGAHPRQTSDVYSKVALVPEEDAMYGALTGRQYVEYAARLSRVDDVPGAAANALEAVAMTADVDRSIGTYSKGMRQRTKVAAALVHDPEILILDEPLNGTDPVQRASLIALFRRFAAEGRTVLVSSHVLQEVERMADRVVAIVDGRLAAAGDIAAIRSAMTDIPYRVRIEADEARRLGAALLNLDMTTGVTVDDTEIHVETSDLHSLGTAMAGLARDLDVRLLSFQPEDESLESTFRYLVRRR